MLSLERVARGSLQQQRLLRVHGLQLSLLVKAGDWIASRHLALTCTLVRVHRLGAHTEVYVLHVKFEASLTTESRNANAVLLFGPVKVTLAGAAVDRLT